MRVKVFLPDFEIHTTPLEEISMDPHTIDIVLDDINEQRFKITAKPYQAMRVTTIDCVSGKDYYNEFSFRGGRYHRHILQIEDSPIIKELRANLIDSGSTFLDDAKHYVLPLQDNFIDIVATGFTVKKL